MKNNIANVQEKKPLSRAERICQLICWAAIGVIVALILL